MSDEHDDADADRPTTVYFCINDITFNVFFRTLLEELISIFQSLKRLFSFLHSSILFLIIIIIMMMVVVRCRCDVDQRIFQAIGEFGYNFKFFSELYADRE